MARKIIVTQYVSLDGVIEDPVGMEGSGLGNWIGPFHRGPAGDKFKEDELAAATAMIYGRRTYQGFASTWPNMNNPFAERMNGLPKYVASRTLKAVDWNNSTLIAGDLVDAARRLKAEGEGDILIYGSGSVGHQLFAAGLVDEVNIMTYPVVVGRGIRLFADNVRLSLKLLEVRSFNDGIVLSRYAC